MAWYIARMQMKAQMGSMMMMAMMTPHSGGVLPA